MARPPRIPAHLRDRPFTRAEALASGLTRKQLEGRTWRRVAPQTYVWAGLPDTPMLRLQGLARRFPPGAAYSGRTAGWLFGLDLEPCNPIEVTLPIPCGLSIRVGIAVRRAGLDAADIMVCGGLPTTVPVRTLFDLANRLPEVEAVVCVDSALRLGLVSMAELDERVRDRRYAKGVRRFRQVVALADEGAESPMESRLRFLLVDAGLPQPVTQAELHDSAGTLLGRADLYYPFRRLAIEYDGGQHRDSMVEDNRRQNRLLNAGYRLLRFTAPDLRDPARIVATVRLALAA